MKTFLAVYIGSAASRERWMQLPEAQRKERERSGIEAWHAWMTRHKAAVVEAGGPLGKTKRVTTQGVADTSNNLSAYTVVRADSHEAAAKLFQNHPHFAIFPGDGVEIMEVLPTPAG
jgi:hypothetical protein